MITVISGTNRPNNTTYKVAKVYYDLLIKNGADAKLLSLTDLPADFAFNNDVYGEKSTVFSAVVKEFISPAEKYIVISPEYNGSFPGVLKSFFDGIWPEEVKGKKVALAGVASGRAGNLRGMDHLTGIFNYLKMHVMPEKVAIAGIDGLLDEKRETIADEKTLKVIERQISDFIDY